MALRADVLGTALQVYPGLPRQGKYLPQLLEPLAEKIIAKNHKGTLSASWMLLHLFLLCISP